MRLEYEFTFKTWEGKYVTGIFDYHVDTNADMYYDYCGKKLTDDEYAEIREDVEECDDEFIEYIEECCRHEAYEYWREIYD